jgi:hypothetical protein
MAANNVQTYLLYEILHQQDELEEVNHGVSLTQQFLDITTPLYSDTILLIYTWCRLPIYFL